MEVGGEETKRVSWAGGCTKGQKNQRKKKERKREFRFKGMGGLRTKKGGLLNKKHREKKGGRGDNLKTEGIPRKG